MVSLGAIANRVLGTANDRKLKTYRTAVDTINALEEQMLPLSDEALKDKTTEFRARLEAGEELNALLPEAFALPTESKALNCILDLFANVYSIGFAIQCFSTHLFVSCIISLNISTAPSFTDGIVSATIVIFNLDVFVALSIRTGIIP
jgi:hypothetical protein